MRPADRGEWLDRDPYLLLVLLPAMDFVTLGVRVSREHNLCVPDYLAPDRGKETLREPIESSFCMEADMKPLTIILRTVVLATIAFVAVAAVAQRPTCTSRAHRPSQTTD